MNKANHTDISEFVLLGFGKLYNLKILIFISFFVIYIATLFGNLLIIILVSTSQQLNTPMYSFLMHLSICDIVFTTNIVPNMLHDILHEVGKMSMKGCVLQFYVYGSSTVAECFILSVMSYDRYLAICNPLLYTASMNLCISIKLVCVCWLLGFLVTLNTSLMVFSRDFCGPKLIDHFICELSPLLKLSCSDTYTVEVVIFTLSVPIILLPFILIIMTYICIFITVLKIPSTSGRQKTFSTCSSHLTSVSTYYGTLIAIYVVPRKRHLLSINKALYLLYTVVTPLFNPIIYSLRNQDIRKAITMLLYKTIL
ncbi:olfactory receptor 11L1-like [Pseudophryne corroboree]|uniref:olfactory receptor 11L1-like n=1 Tax=Pseudophryne corroboree TaxID=495146 RepID=UPI003081C9C0